MNRKKNNNPHQKQHTQGNKPTASNDFIDDKLDELSRLEQAIADKRKRVFLLSHVTDNPKVRYRLLKMIRKLIALLIRYGIQQQAKYPQNIADEIGYLNSFAGEIFVALNDIRLAKECFWDSIRYKPEQYLSYYHLAVLAIDNDNYHEAYKYVNSAIKYTSNDTEHNKMLYLMGCIEFSLGKIDEAIVSFKILIKAKMAIANYPLCLCYVTKKQHQEINEIAKQLEGLNINDELLKNFNQCLLIASAIFISDSKIDLHDFRQKITIDFENVNHKIPCNYLDSFTHYFNKALKIAEKRQARFNLYKAVPSKQFNVTIDEGNQPSILGENNVYRN